MEEKNVRDRELLLTIDVTCLEPCEVQGQELKIVMVPFTARAYGEYFNGETIGTGVDTQRYEHDGTGRLSARYMLKGRDKAGGECSIFIENSTHDDEGWHPLIVTDSPLLSEWEHIPLTATVDGKEGGVVVRIFRVAG